MTIPVLFVQGAGRGAHDKWDMTLVASLRRHLGPDYLLRYPRMPGEEDPQVADWIAVLSRELAVLPDGAIVIGHSVGGTVLVHHLSEAPLPFTPGAVILLAPPFIGPGGWPRDGQLTPRSEFLAGLPPTVPVLLVHGTADDTVPVGHIELYARAIPRATLRRLADRDHQFNNDLSEVAAEIRRLHR